MVCRISGNFAHTLSRSYLEIITLDGVKGISGQIRSDGWAA
jgi:hypothetical protein